MSLNLITYQFESAKLESLLNYNQNTHAFLFEFQTETGNTIFKNEKAENILKSILNSVVEKHSEILSN